MPAGSWLVIAQTTTLTCGVRSMFTRFSRTLPALLLLTGVARAADEPSGKSAPSAPASDAKPGAASAAGPEPGAAAAASVTGDAPVETKPAAPEAPAAAADATGATATAAGTATATAAANADVAASATTADVAGSSYEPTIPAPPGDVALLPPEAYPSQPIRGIHGGSLWLTFHGMQWPYSPFVTQSPRTQLGLSGSVWVDTSYKAFNSEGPNVRDNKRFVSQGRLVLRATPTYTKGSWFVQGQAELVANKDQSVSQSSGTGAVVDTDDLWVRAGRWNAFDVQAGRFEAWELFHLGLGLDLNTLEREGAFDGGFSGKAPPEIYGVTYTYYRPNSLGNIAFHIYPKNFIRAEALTQLGSEGGQNTWAARGAVIVDLGMIKLKGGGEYKKNFHTLSGNEDHRESRGFGGAIQVVLDPRAELGLHFGYGLIDTVDQTGTRDPAASTTTYTLGGFANARLVGELLLGVGADYTRKDDIHEERNGDVGEFSHFQGFGALQYLLFDQLFIKGVVAYAKADSAPTFQGVQPYSETAVSGRLRLMYLF